MCLPVFFILPLIGCLAEVMPLVMLTFTLIYLIHLHKNPEMMKKVKEYFHCPLQTKEFHCQFKTNSCDYKETRKAYHIYLEIPGSKKEEINVECEKNVIRISCPCYGYDLDENSVKEIKTHEYKKEITLPESANMENIIATYENGILSIIVEKKPECVVPKRTISIN